MRLKVSLAMAQISFLPDYVKTTKNGVVVLEAAENFSIRVKTQLQAPTDAQIAAAAALQQETDISADLLFNYQFAKTN